jgi:hypothetical protein
MFSARSIPCLLPLLLLAGCGVDVGADREQIDAADPVASHDFGVIPHGELRAHDFVVGGDAFWATHEPLDVEVDCTCVGATWTWISTDVDTGHGSRRGVTVTLRIDLRHEAPVDENCCWREAYLRVRSLDETAVDEVLSIPLRYRYGVDSPVSVLPSSVLDLGPVSRSNSGAVFCKLHVDDGMELKLLQAGSEDPRLSCQLAPGEMGAEMLVTLLPGPSTPLGLYAATVTVATSRDGYVLHLPVRARIID